MADLSESQAKIRETLARSLAKAQTEDVREILRDAIAALYDLADVSVPTHPQKEHEG